MHVCLKANNLKDIYIDRDRMIIRMTLFILSNVFFFLNTIRKENNEQHTNI